MRRRLFLIVAALIMTIGTVMSGVGLDLAWANTSSFEQQIQEVQKEKNETEKEAKKKEQELAKVEAEIQELNKEIKRIDDETANTSQQITKKKEEIEVVTERIEELQEEIRILEERIAERDEILKERARSMYQNGGSISYLEVILGAKSFGDFLDRVSALSMIAQQDRSILDAHISDQEQLEETKTLVEAELQKLEGHLVQLEGLMVKLEDSRKEKDKIMDKLGEEEDKIYEELGELENAAEILAAQEVAIKKEKAAYEERLRKEEEERKKQEQLSKQSGGNSSTPSRHAAPSDNGSAVFMRPATGSITSGFGQRWGRLHAGIDIGKNGRTGDVPVVAAGAGTVVDSFYSSSYGNTVIISHMIDGRTVTTLYAHLENRAVSRGQSVERGQFLGNMGNTGRSTGPHLHFEVHEGPWNGQANARNPMNYIQ
ncbi:murein hydrolase activator EnvC family protein [Bacillus alkalicellulosilyticus]|uniref:murein hydrolase activator EnvC family protein n=1 Tax=Alkalihalobacterium alkalicellulosilyticum TaxID=1912214 RepID=UPI000997B9C4|nr:peptidoglycan DD-metalloendopeptidase family protein [Bacillus alkalicellulosilyticus]